MQRTHTYIFERYVHACSLMYTEILANEDKKYTAVL